MTVVTYSNMVNLALEVAAALAEDGMGVEVIDLRSLVPLDVDTIATSARKTGVVLAAHESWTFGGFGAEILAQVREAVPDQARSGPTGSVPARRRSRSARRSNRQSCRARWT